MVYVTSPYDQDVTLNSSPDDVTIPMNIEWFDERTGASPPAIIHRFQIDTTYGGTPYTRNEERTTNGNMGTPGTDSFYVEVSGVTTSTSIYVYYSVSVRYQSGGTLCSVDNSWQVPPTWEPSFNFV